MEERSAMFGLETGHETKTTFLACIFVANATFSGE